MEKEILFEEKQRFRQWWLWILLLGINGMFFYGVYQQVISGQQFGDKPMDDYSLLTVTGLSLLFTIIFFNLRLDTRIQKDGIYFRFFPIHLSYRHYSWDNIDKSFVRQYNPVLEYGGWGLRLGLFGKGKAFNVSGNKGIQIVFTNGKKVLLGTNKPEEAEEALKQCGHFA